MTGTGRFQEVRAIMEAIKGLSPESRVALLDERCADDPELRSEVEAQHQAARDAFRALLTDEQLSVLDGIEAERAER